MQVTQLNLIQLYHPQVLTPQTRDEIEAVIASPAIQQYMIEHTLQSIITNVDLNTAGASGDYMRGLNEGALDLLNSLITGQTLSATQHLTPKE